MGRVHAMVQLSGVNPAQAGQTTLSFTSTMPAMGMSGGAGTGIPMQGMPGMWTFDVTPGTAGQWTITVQFRGGITGSATYKVAVASAQAPHAPPAALGVNTAANMPSAPGMQGMAGMSASSTGNPQAWRTAFFALLVLVIIGFLILRRDRRPVALWLGAAAVIAIALLAFLQARYTPAPMDMASMENVAGNAAVPVKTVRVHRGGDPSGSVLAPGVVEPYFTQDVVTRAPGMLTDFTAYDGDRVRAGEILARLDEPELHSDAQAAFANARAAQEGVVMAHHDAMIAQADLAAKAEQRRYWDNEIVREQTLLHEGAVSTQEYEDERSQAIAARSAYEVAQTKLASTGAEIESARAQTASASATAQSRQIMADYTVVVAPDDAIVVKRLVDPGVYVSAGTPIARIAVIGKLRIQANVAQTDLPRITIGDPLQAQLLDGAAVRGRVTSVEPVADATTHTATVEAIVENATGEIQPGGFVRVAIRTRIGQSGGVAVPSTALVGGYLNPSIWLDANGVARRIPVRVLSNDGVSAVVQGNIPNDARVITDGAELLQEGVAVSEQSQ
jgi:multidrug efflux pump subunit AcrA (membrane-fusion protein)